MLQWLKISDPVGLFIEVACEMTWVLGLLLYPVDNVWIRMMFGLSIALGIFLASALVNHVKLRAKEGSSVATKVCLGLCLRVLWLLYGSTYTETAVAVGHYASFVFTDLVVVALCIFSNNQLRAAQKPEPTVEK